MWHLGKEAQTCCALCKNLGEFYVETNRADKAKKLLKILKACNCEEYVSLKNTIKISNSK